MRRLSVEEVRDRQLELLEQLDTFCQAHGITYYAFAGTLLGTARHRGFIPWDNDIDVAVSRADYGRMQELLKSDDAHPYFRFLCHENDPEYLWQHGRVSAKGTFMKTARGYSRLGLSIDIFPLDSQGDERRAAERNLRKIRECVRMRIMAYDHRYKKLTYPKCTLAEKVRLWFKFFILRRNTEEYWVDRHIRLAQTFNGCSGSRYYGCNSNDKYCVVCERSMYDGVQRLPFEGTTIPVPAGYKEILTLYYGDYMQPPPREKQVGAREMSIYVEE